MANKMKHTGPVSKGVAKVPVIMQYEKDECGAVSLAMILGYYDKWLPSGEIRSDTGPCRDGSNIHNIARAARFYGLETEVHSYTADEFFEHATFPCIIHWDYVHFLVVRGIRGNKVYFNDPSKGSYAIPKEAFREKYTENCAFFKPKPEFEPSGHRKKFLEYARDYLHGSTSSLIFVFLTTLLSSVLTMIRYSFARIFIDRLLSGRNPDWAVPFFIIFISLAVVLFIVQAFQSFYMIKINGRMSVTETSSYMWHIFHLPMSFFEQRLSGDISFRKTLNAEVASSLVNTFAVLVLEAGMMLLYMIVMFTCSPTLALIGIGSVVINAIVGQIISKLRVNITRTQMMKYGQLNGTMTSGIQMIETIKASGAENGFFEKWGALQAEANTQQVKYERVNRYLGLISFIVSSLTGTIVLLAGVYLILRGEFTPGLLMSFQGFLTSFSQPATRLINSGQEMQEMRTKMERIGDVMDTPEDILWRDEPVAEDKSYKKLSGQISMKNITFGYNRLEDPLIVDFNLELKPGQSVAFVGPSGCGKSTLAKLISGLSQPKSGSVTFDGVPLLDIDRGVFTGSVAVVDQAITLFEDTIENNIKMWDRSIENFEMILAARDAQIHDEIMTREGGYQYEMLAGGKDFSGGQRQRLELARVLAQDPSIIILDEATSALDARTEFSVVKAIQERGITCIVIAHRLSTIRDCDEIVVMNHGKVVERGTHNQLLAKGGTYAELVNNE